MAKGGGSKRAWPRAPQPRGGPIPEPACGARGMGTRPPTESGDTCAGSPGRRASGTGQPPEVWLVRARPPGQQPAPPPSCQLEPPSSAAGRVAEAREGRAEPERDETLKPGGKRQGRGRPRPFIAGERPRALRPRWREEQDWERSPAPRGGACASATHRAHRRPRRQAFSSPSPPPSQADTPGDAGPSPPNSFLFTLTRSWLRSEPSAFH